MLVQAKPMPTYLILKKFKVMPIIFNSRTKKTKKKHMLTFYNFRPYKIRMYFFTFMETKHMPTFFTLVQTKTVSTFLSKRQNS